MSKMTELHARGQSIWLDYIERGLITSGELKGLISDGLLGLTSNPSLFEKAIAESREYDDELQKLAPSKLDDSAIYEELAILDIQKAADEFHSAYAATHGRDGFVSLEVSPELAHDTDGTISEARRLWQRVARPNLMIKVPGTPEGLPAIERLISEGINVNVTLLFSVSVYEEVARRYSAGLARRAAAGNDISSIASVASFFVSRVDTAVDALLEKRLEQAPPEQQADLKQLLGKAAIANAKLAYQRYFGLFSDVGWNELAKQGAKTQRLLWASTGTKNKNYSDVMYLEELIGRDTVNTVPLATLHAFRDHGRIRDSLLEDLPGARRAIDSLAALGISMSSVADNLLDEGEQQFLKAFRKMLNAVSRSRQTLPKAAGSR
jgi:transaldolase / glucose-6-phosphate isomerase